MQALFQLLKSRVQQAGTEDGNDVKDIERLEFAADPLGEVDGSGLISTLQITLGTTIMQARCQGRM